MPQKRKDASRRTYSATLGDRGRLVLPARLRKELQLHPHDRLLLTVQRDGSVRMSSVRERIDSAMGMYAHIAPGRDLVAELIRERRKEARDEASR